MVTITGKGFPEDGSGRNDTVQVTLPGGATCTVLTSSYTTIRCIAGAQPSGAASPAAVRGMFPGMRGMLVERYPNR
jgi:hypothetical protein